MDSIERFLKDEISSQKMYESIYDFITSLHVRNGEFEGNYYIIKKMDVINFIIYPENIYPNKQREIPSCFSIYKDDLIAKINLRALDQGLIIRD